MSDNVIAAAQWLAQRDQHQAAVIPALRREFDLSALEACQACKLASDLRSDRRGRHA